MSFVASHENHFMMSDELATRIDDTVATIAAAGDRAPAAGAALELVDLFRALATAQTQRERVEAEDLIWALWYSHPDQSLARRMNKAIGAIARGEFANASGLLDALVLDAPGWAEVWNKRATLYFLQECDLESVRDIQRTLELEPRHFGAMSGFGQICLRAGDEASALVAFQAALALNPNLDSVRETLSAIERRLPRILH